MVLSSSNCVKIMKDKTLQETITERYTAAIEELRFQIANPATVGSSQVKYYHSHNLTKGKQVAALQGMIKTLEVEMVNVLKGVSSVKSILHQSLQNGENLEEAIRKI